MKVSEVALELDVHKSTASRILATLQKEGFLRLNSHKEYQLGFTIFELANSLKEKIDLLSVAKPHMQTLGKATGETIHLAIFDNNEIVYLDKIDSSRSFRMYSRIGRRAKAHCTGIGKALIAYLPKEEVNVKKFILTRYTNNTIVDPEILVDELKTIRKHCLAWDREEHEEDIFCIAAPIFDFNNYAIASISITTTIKYTPLEKLDSFIPDLHIAAKHISREMGYTGNYPLIISEEGEA